jgi:UDP-glucose 4-epimerase
MTQRVLVTGATGFIGRALLPALVSAGFAVRAATRTDALPDAPVGVDRMAIGDLSARPDLRAALDGVSAVVHLAALAHTDAPESAYLTLNRDAPLRLAEAAARAGVERFVFLSSIRAQSGPVASEVLTEDDAPRPTDAYGRAKLEAEQGLCDLAPGLAILRPVLVVGAGAGGNLALLERLAALPLPLPLAGIGAPRSVVSRRSVVDAILLALRHSGWPRAPLIIAEPEPVTLPDLIGALRAREGRAAGLFPLPGRLLAGLAGLAGQRASWQRIASPLVASPARLMALGWRPDARPLAQMLAD